MDMYPYVETLKVGAAYAALLYIWPCILFRGVLRNKGLTFRFLFCSMVQPVLLSTAVLTMGVLHILNVWIVRALFWGALTVSLLGPLRERLREGGVRLRLPLHALITRSYGWKLFFFRIKEALALWWKKSWRQYRERFVEYFILAAILLFGMAFFLNGAFQDYSFGCNDEYTHYRWASALLNGEIFSGGIYPEGMHCFLYALHVLFGVKLHSCVLFLAGIHNSSTFLLAAYCLLKVLFRNRHVPLFVLTAWISFDGIGSAALESMTRMAWTLPEEFALYMVFLCPLVMLRYLWEQHKPEKWYRDENLLLLMAGVALVVSTHIYVLILVFCSCCAVLVVYYREFWPVSRLFALVCAAFYGLELGAFPMLVACAMGTELEGSLLWGFNTLRGAVGASTRLTDSTTISYFARHNPLKELYESGYLSLFGEMGAVLLILLSLLVPVLAFVLVAVYVYRHRRERLQKVSALASVLASVYVSVRRRKKFKEAAMPIRMMEGYLTLIAALTVFVLLYAMPYMGLPELVTIDRTLCITQMLAFGAAGILVDLLIVWMGHLKGKMLSCYWMALGCLILYLLAYISDFHQCTYWWLRRYNAAVTVTDQIMNNYPEWTYKIVSMTDEAYQVGWGSHEELLTFLENTDGEDYSLPVEYIFLYVEKHPLMRGQVHFLTAPPWMAQNNYEIYEGLWNQSQCPDIMHGRISQDLALKETPYYPEVYDNYDNLTMRTILCSKIYNWYQEFSAAHPAETNVYYEDDDFVCYLIHQDQAAPLQLGRGDGK